MFELAIHLDRGLLLRGLPDWTGLLLDVDGVAFINDAQGANLSALDQARWAAPGGRGGQPNVVLIAGGRDDGQEFHDVGPLLSPRVKQALVTGPASDKLRAAWSPFTPCTPVASLLEAVQRSAATAVPGDVVLRSPACPSHDSQEGSHDRGEAFRPAVAALPRGGRERDGHASPGAGDADVQILERLTENRAH